jgi:hypothetical protein
MTFVWGSHLADMRADLAKYETRHADAQSRALGEKAEYQRAYATRSREEWATVAAHWARRAEVQRRHVEALETGGLSAAIHTTNGYS